MMAILYCRNNPVERIHGASQEKVVSDALSMMERLTDDERRDWSLVIIQHGQRAKRLFGPTI